MTITSFFLLHIGTAILPPHHYDDTDTDTGNDEYYTILQLPKKRTTTTAEIRKAYKTLSLQYHPDKVTQRRQVDPVTAQQQYEKIQEAYAVLSDDTKRRIYIDYNYSIRRYKFIQEPPHPMVYLQNIQQATCYNKTKLWCFITFVFIVIFLLQPLLIAIKVNAITGTTTTTPSSTTTSPFYNTSWYSIFIPFWITIGLYTLLCIGMFLLQCIASISFSSSSTTTTTTTATTTTTNGNHHHYHLPTKTYEMILGIPESLSSSSTSDTDGTTTGTSSSTNTNTSRSRSRSSKYRTTMTHLFLQLLYIGQLISMIVGVVLLIEQWDRPITQKQSYLYNAIPFYCMIFCIVVRQIILVQQIRYVLSCMISTTKANDLLLLRRQQQHQSVSVEDDERDHSTTTIIEWDDATEEQQDVILQEYMVVQYDETEYQEASSIVLQIKKIQQQQQQQEDDNDNENNNHNDVVLTEEELEEIRIQCSTEHTILQTLKKQYHSSIGKIVIIYGTLIALITSKLQQQITVSWWIIFIPLWILYGTPMFLVVCSCCCSSSSSFSSLSSMDSRQYQTTYNDPQHESMDPVEPTTTTKTPSTNTGIEIDVKSSPNNDDNNIVTTTVTATIINNGKTSTDEEQHSDDNNHDVARMVPDDDLDDDMMMMTKMKQSLSVEFASPDGDINEFNQEANSRSPPPPPTTSATTTTSLPTTSRNTDPEDPNKNVEKENRDEKDYDDDDVDDDHNYSNPYAEGRANAEQNVDGCSSCCIMIVLCLMVAKLEQSYNDLVLGNNNDDENDNDRNNGFNTLWILFPLFLLSGCIIMMCTCLICSWSPRETTIDDMSSYMNNGDSTNATTATTKPTAAAASAAAATGNENNSNMQSAPSTIYVVPLPTDSIGATTTTTAAAAFGNTDTDLPVTNNNNNVSTINLPDEVATDTLSGTTITKGNDTNTGVAPGSNIDDLD